MPSLPIISGAVAIRALLQLGFVVVRQRGSHVILRRGFQNLNKQEKFIELSNSGHLNPQ